MIVHSQNVATVALSARANEQITVAALYVDPRGPYPAIDGVDCWDISRDARRYPGPWPVVAHPPCGRWCARLAPLNERRWGARVGDDGGCFEAALAAVRAWGGVLEHPASSLAWNAFGLQRPPALGWQKTLAGEWVCEVWQSAYGHRATKRTWLLFVGHEPIDTDWRRVEGSHQIGAMDRRKPVLWGKHAVHTPPRFAEYLVRLARAARRTS